MTLTPNQIRIAIAEALGYTYHGDPDLKLEALLCWAAPGDEYHPMRPAMLPNYPEDLNACAQFEATLTDDEGPIFRHWLAKNSDGRGAKYLTVEAAMCHASALDRCLAFLRVKRPEMFQPIKP